MTDATHLILASSSPYRAELLARLRLAFTVEAPAIDETPRPGEAPRALALRLAVAKARAVAAHHPFALVIGSDQVATLDGTGVIGKPGDHAGARAQLHAASGRTMHFHTAVCALRVHDSHFASTVVDARVRFRRLEPHEIERYLALEQPWDCAGSAKVEGLGIALLEAIDSGDPTALVGLPLIALAAMLREAGVSPLHAAPRPAPRS